MTGSVEKCSRRSSFARDCPIHLLGKETKGTDHGGFEDEEEREDNWLPQHHKIRHNTRPMERFRIKLLEL
jgi:hypothetical protein